MSWPFMTLKILYILQVIFSLTIIALLISWIVITKSYIYSYENYFSTSNAIRLPGDFYVTFVLGSISFIVAAALSIPNVTRKLGYTFFTLFADVLLAISWLVIAIYTASKATNGSFIDSKYVMTENIAHSLHELPEKDEWISKSMAAAELGCAILAFEWTCFFTWTMISILLFHVRSRRWINRKSEQNKRITICSSYGMESSDEQDAKMLTTPKIIQKIDDLLKSPQLTKQSKRISSIVKISNKPPVLELNPSINNSTTKTYSLTNNTFSPIENDNHEDYYNIDINDEGK